MKLTKNFSLEEMVKSETAKKYFIPNKPTEADVYRMYLLCEKLLQPLRDRLGRPIIINSGYRSKELNKKIGGVKNSQHMAGQAADIHIPGMELKDVFELINNELPFDQLILELDRWIHVSYDLIRNRFETLVAYKENERIRYRAYS